MYGNSTKYGNKNTSQIAALTGMQTGDTVFNLDYGMVEVYNGAVWTNTCSVVATSGSGLSEGQLVYINTSGKVVLLSTSTTEVKKAIGVVQYGALATDQTVLIRTHGIAKCFASTAVTIGNYATTAGSGEMTQTTSATTSTFGRILQTVGIDNLCYVALTFIERG